MKIYQVCICTLCGNQADWQPDWRQKEPAFSWQCNDSSHGGKHLEENETKWIDVIPLMAVDELWDRVQRLEK